MNGLNYDICLKQLFLNASTGLMGIERNNWLGSGVIKTLVHRYISYVSLFKEVVELSIRGIMSVLHILNILDYLFF